MASYINVHTHIFSRQHVSEYVVGQNRYWITVGIPQLARFGNTALKLTYPFLRLFMGKDKANRLLKFAQLGLATRQETLYTQLVANYAAMPDDFRFVILPMDMSYMGAGFVESNLKSQLEEIIQLRQNPVIANKLLPFFPVDPRGYESGEKLLETVKPYFEQHGFVGIKLYPALGYFPFDEKMMPLYAWTIENRVPIMTHCIAGVIHWQGSMLNWQEMIQELNGQWDPLWSAYPKGKPEKLDRGIFQRNFTMPSNFERAVQRLSDLGVANARELKVCFGHFGMDEEEVTGPENWFTACKRLIQEYPNFYADVSYVLAESRLRQRMEEVTIKAVSPLKDKVLFGTDYFVVSKELTEDEILKYYSASRIPFAPFADTNARAWLSSAFYSA